MTGEKNRYTTTEKLWKLDDDTLKTPMHDQMVLWLLNKDNVSKMLSPYLEPYIYFTAYENTRNIIERKIYDFFGRDDFWHKLKNKELDSNLDYIDSEDQDTLHPNESYSKTWEEMIVEYFKCNDSSIDILDYEIASEVPITAENGFLVGYLDIQIVIKHSKEFRGKFFKKVLSNKIWNIEVKPKIDSFGATLRQLNTYKHYLHNSDLYLFTTDMQFKDAFESQGIEILTYPSDVNNNKTIK